MTVTGQAVLSSSQNCRKVTVEAKRLPSASGPPPVRLRSASRAPPVQNAPSNGGSEQRRVRSGLLGSVSPLQRWPPGASLGVSLDRFPPYNGGLQAPPWAPPWVGFPLTTVASRRLPGRLPGPVSPLQWWPPGASLGASLGSLGLPGLPWAVRHPFRNAFVP